MSEDNQNNQANQDNHDIQNNNTGNNDKGSKIFDFILTPVKAVDEYIQGVLDGDYNIQYLLKYFSAFIVISVILTICGYITAQTAVRFILGMIVLIIIQSFATGDMYLKDIILQYFTRVKETQETIQQNQNNKKLNEQQVNIASKSFSTLKEKLIAKLSDPKESTEDLQDYTGVVEVDEQSFKVEKAEDTPKSTVSLRKASDEDDVIVSTEDLLKKDLKESEQESATYQEESQEFLKPRANDTDQNEPIQSNQASTYSSDFLYDDDIEDDNEDTSVKQVDTLKEDVRVDTNMEAMAEEKAKEQNVTSEDTDMDFNFDGEVDI